ncbi:hypothetical protein DNK34_21785 [Pseudomonas dryadis]|uniref:DUF6795 domain-containing protein n=2 Tax=Pseudomonadales TaxID=72274 RepID=A0ABY1Z4X4_9GAMM|nr:hypothetical protein DNK34_21785 [Pseudomonas dryadis]TBV13800.1 hypothetical protein DNK41_21475 [Pseudomonas sp. FRB 230]
MLFATFSIALFFLLQEPAMAKPLYMFSEVKGTVLLNGEPVAGAEIEQSYIWLWDQKKRTFSSTTDQQGHFSLEERVEKSFFATVIPTGQKINQTITIRHNGKEYDGWLHDKDNYAKNSESANGPFKLVCELSDTPGAHPESKSYGICVLTKD